MSLVNACLPLRLGRYRGSSDYDHRGCREKPTQHLRHAVLLLRKPADSVQDNKMSSPLLMVCICPAGVETQSGLSLRPRRHLIGRRQIRFLWLGIHRNKPIVAIPIRTDVSGDYVSQRVETISDKVPIVAVRLDKVLQELVVLWRP